MKAKELMCDDIVLHHGNAYKVFSILGKDNRVNLFPIHTRNAEGLILMPIGCFAKDTEPIPLTAEILEKNGFDSMTFLTAEWGKEVYFREFPGCVVEPDDAGYTFGTIRYWNKQANDGSPEDWGTMYESRICNMHYVHELQHALRLCGLTDLADNFRV